MSNVISIVPQINKRIESDELKQIDEVFDSLADNGYTNEVFDAMKSYRKDTHASLEDIKEVADPLRSLHQCSEGHSMLLAINFLRRKQTTET